MTLGDVSVVETGIEKRFLRGGTLVMWCKCGLFAAGVSSCCTSPWRLTGVEALWSCNMHVLFITS